MKTIAIGCFIQAFVPVIFNNMSAKISTYEGLNLRCTATEIFFLSHYNGTFLNRKH